MGEVRGREKEARRDVLTDQGQSWAAFTYWAEGTTVGRERGFWGQGDEGTRGEGEREGKGGRAGEAWQRGRSLISQA